MLVTIDSENPQENLIKRIVEVLEKGKIIAYPTDTIYGIGCDVLNKDAIAKVYQIKQMPKQKPLSFICKDLKQVAQYAQVSNFDYKLMNRLLPGPYTFILRATKLATKISFNSHNTVGIRIPDNKICQALLNAFGKPILSTSAAVEKGETLSDPIEIEKKFGLSLEFVIDGGTLVSDPSSIIDLTNDENPRVVREGKGDLSHFLAPR